MASMGVPEDSEQAFVSLPRSLINAAIQDISNIPNPQALVITGADKEATCRVKSQRSNKRFVALKSLQTLSSKGGPNLDFPVV